MLRSKPFAVWGLRGAADAPVAPHVHVALAALTVVVSLAAVISPAQAAPEGASGALSFDERVGAQRAIERVYHSYREGSRRAFDETVPRAVLERKVRASLARSAALERVWHRPVTGAALRRELERIAANTCTRRVCARSTRCSATTRCSCRRRTCAPF